MWVLLFPSSPPATNSLFTFQPPQLLSLLRDNGDYHDSIPTDRRIASWTHNIWFNEFENWARLDLSKSSGRHPKIDNLEISRQPHISSPSSTPLRLVLHQRPKRLRHRRLSDSLIRSSQRVCLQLFYLEVSSRSVVVNVVHAVSQPRAKPHCIYHAALRRASTVSHQKGGSLSKQLPTSHSVLLFFIAVWVFPRCCLVRDPRIRWPSARHTNGSTKGSQLTHRCYLHDSFRIPSLLRHGLFRLQSNRLRNSANFHVDCVSSFAAPFPLHPRSASGLGIHASSIHTNLGNKRLAGHQREG